MLEDERLENERPEMDAQRVAQARAAPVAAGRCRRGADGSPSSMEHEGRLPAKKAASNPPPGSTAVHPPTQRSLRDPPQSALADERRGRRAAAVVGGRTV